MSWKDKRKNGIPAFKDYSFVLDSDLEIKTISVL